MSEREELFGNDLKIVNRGAGVDLEAGASGDLALARGRENIAQALVLRLQMRRGDLEHLGWPDYGSRLHELIGEPNNRRTHAKAMAFARDALEQDPRVRRVTKLESRILPGERDTLRLLLQIALIGEPNPLNLVFDQKLH